MSRINANHEACHQMYPSIRGDFAYLMNETVSKAFVNSEMLVMYFISQFSKALYFGCNLKVDEL